MSKRVNSFDIPIYGGTLHICIGEPLSIAKKHFKIEYEHPDRVKECNAICTKKNYLNFIIIFNEHVVGNYGTASHEAKHFVNHLFSERGIMLDLANDEAECYMLGWTVKQIQKAFEQWQSTSKDQSK